MADAEEVTTGQEFHEEMPLLPLKPSDHNQDIDIIDTDDNGDLPHKGYSLPVAICFATNYLIGAGILGLPYEFYSAGYILSSVMIIFLGFLTYITDIWIVNGIMYAEALSSLSRSLPNVAITSKYDLISKSQYIKRNLIQNADISNINIIESHFQINRNEYQLSELIGIFGGKWWRLSYDLAFMISSIIMLWSYNVLFGVSLTQNIGISSLSSSCNMESDATTSCRGLYSFWVCMFWIWTLCITLIDFKHQQWLQVFATSARIFIIILMITTSIGLIYSNWYYDGTDYIYTTNESESAIAWNWSGLPYMIAIAAFAFGNQFSIPDVIQPLSLKDKQSKQHVLWGSVTAFCAIVYILCGITISIYFGANTQSPCTLAWKGFMGFGSTETQPTWALVFSWFILMLPAIDIGSAFPLIATTVSNTLYSILMVVILDNDKIDIDVNNGEMKYIAIIKICLCTLVSILALIEWDFELILAFAGAFGMLAVYIGPCVLQWKSKQYMDDILDEYGVNSNQHEMGILRKKGMKWMSHYIWLFIITGVALIGFVSVCVYTITDNL